MRAKIASRAGGHAFEKRFLDLDAIQLAVLYRQAITEEEAERKSQVDLIRNLNDIWVSNFQALFDELRLFVNPEMYFKVKEMMKLEAFREEITPEEFPSKWEKLMKVIPKEYVVHEVMSRPTTERLPVADPEVEEVFAGWVAARTQRPGAKT